jgi:hypothetical protein
VGFLKGEPAKAKVAPPSVTNKYALICTMTDTDSAEQKVNYIEKTSLQQSVHNFLVASAEKEQKICILENQNQKHNIENRKKR